MHRTHAYWGVVAMLLALPATLRSQQAEILWDTWGVPHIYARDDAGAFYGMGWAEAESYGDLLLNAYLQSRGEAARFLGAGAQNLDSDRWVRTLNVGRVARDWERQQTPAFATDLRSFVAGVNVRRPLHDGSGLHRPPARAGIARHWKHKPVFRQQCHRASANVCRTYPPPGVARPRGH
jgi:Penicillin amidase